ncbi:hypothetical protein G6F37_010815 [Rhizopus arrhizus]|nr:hypothetical protein G6F38_010445 [Rhizopus arrhizus]KAG1152313.1 hypothetical protein G6F37_010815 [Rhizopus arrhizus]
MLRLNNTYTAKTYQPMIEKIEVPVADYKTIIDGSIGKKEVKEQTNLTGKSRELQKASKKCHCPARLKVTCFKRNPEMVTVEAIGEHNHEIGGLEDLQHLPLSKEARDYIEGRLNEGYGKRDTRISIQKNYRMYMQNLSANFSGSSSSVMHRDQMVHADEIYNIYKKIQEKFYKRAQDQRESVKIWLEELTVESGYKTFVGTDFDDNFTFGLSSPWQQQLLLQATSICLDATHCVTNIVKAILYTIVIRHPLTGTGCPVAYMFTEDHSMYPIKEFPMFVRVAIGLQVIRKITIDVSATEYRAIQAVYPTATVQWCLFHVARAWMSKIRVLIKLGSTAQKAQVHKFLITSLKSMMWEKNVPECRRKLAEIFVNYASYPEFLEYFRKNYLDDNKFIQWSAAFQPQTYTNMETNNFVESWHNQLKSTYFQRKRNRRIDRLIFIPVNDIEPDFIANTNRIQLNAGRMGPEEHRRRKRELETESFNEEVLPLMIEEREATEAGERIFKINSFTTEGIAYDIKVAQEEMKEYSCPDFTWSYIACKHMYLLKRFKRNILLYMVSTSLPSLQMIESVPEIEDSTIAEILPFSPSASDGLLAITHFQNAVNESISNFMQNPQQLTPNQINSLTTIRNAISNILNNNNIQPTNQDLETQRR